MFNPVKKTPKPQNPKTPKPRRHEMLTNFYFFNRGDFP